jgi:hypothetical protein
MSARFLGRTLPITPLCKLVILVPTGAVIRYNQPMDHQAVLAEATSGSGSPLLYVVIGVIAVFIVFVFITRGRR